MKLNPTKLAAALYQEVETQSKRTFLLAHRRKDESPILVIGGRPVPGIRYDIHFRSVTGDFHYSNQEEKPFAPFQMLFGEVSPKKVGVCLYGEQESPLLEFLTGETGVEGLISVAARSHADQSTPLGIVHGVFLKDGRSSVITDAHSDFMKHVFLLNEVLTREPAELLDQVGKHMGVNELEPLW